MQQIGITGGIGSGKSLICKIFQTLGAPIYEADSRAKWLMVNYLPLKEQIIQHFGKEAYLPNGELNRNFLAKEVFNDSAKTQLINHLVHPCVGEDYQRWVRENSHFPYVLNEAALLFEAGRDKVLDKIITVFAPKALRIKRIQQRDKHRSLQEIEAIMDKQISEEEKIKRADFVIYNDDVQPVLPQVLHLHHLFLR
ncbi:MAG: dephospho-CoA kinase [Microscillaceae bacterium]|nr:dephospho-CoA kinase [Microscillaceae bacterium]MDW8459618.1 dephospho-CoA kinase [Cytophagales bacterium]